VVSIDVRRNDEVQVSVTKRLRSCYFADDRPGRSAVNQNLVPFGCAKQCRVTLANG
jgi:hypothetical protein